ncbi:hypothetical protein PsorP6_000828 [Peronosclerospora sorghi]|uniref:Uncharacterized protein n=1 Tax=Peronosclerospora sorghi TaxID=230839 RepID=A0ACC0WRN2_9STRA|nr:hypothetical protein PsorP6_000828 [Peronosclerospora sorghi]
MIKRDSSCRRDRCEMIYFPTTSTAWSTAAVGQDVITPLMYCFQTAVFDTTDAITGCCCTTFRSVRSSPGSIFATLGMPVVTGVHVVEHAAAWPPSMDVYG